MEAEYAMFLMEKKYDVVALGELLVDMAEGPKAESGNMTFEACPGGAPCNVLAMLNHLGKKVAFIGKVGDDFLGHMLKNTIEEVGIDSTGLLVDGNYKTTLAFVHKKPDGDRDFSFYRNPGADMMLKKDEVDLNLIESAKIFHFGTLSTTDKEVKEATFEAVKKAKESGVLVSFDPNLREPLWRSLDDAKEMMLWGIKNCDILKISDNEVEFLTGKTDMKAGLEDIKAISSAKVIFVTLGKDGSMAYANGNYAFKEGFKVENVVDTTGAGDTFCGTALSYILDAGVELSKEQLLELLTKANKNASEITKKKGALKAIGEI